MQQVRFLSTSAHNEALKCASALFTLYDSALLSNKYNDDDKSGLLTSIEATSNRVVQFATLLFGNTEKVNIDTLSPFVPYSLYQAAVVQFRLWKRTETSQYKEAMDSLKEILGHFARRWQIAGTIC